MRSDQAKMSHLLKTARGQIDRIITMVEEDAYCIDISGQLMSAEGMLKKANRQVLHDHMEGCLLEAVEQGNYEEKIKEIMAIVDKLSK